MLLISSPSKWFGCSTSREFPSVLESFLPDLIWESLGCFPVEQFREMVLYNSLLTAEFLCSLSEFFSLLNKVFQPSC